MKWKNSFLIFIFLLISIVGNAENLIAAPVENQSENSEERFFFSGDLVRLVMWYPTISFEMGVVDHLSIQLGLGVTNSFLFLTDITRFELTGGLRGYIESKWKGLFFEVRGGLNGFNASKNNKAVYTQGSFPLVGGALGYKFKDSAPSFFEFLLGYDQAVGFPNTGAFFDTFMLVGNLRINLNIGTSF